MQATVAKNDAEKMGMIVKRVSVPIGLEELMEGLTKEVLLKKPKDLYVFASEYFSRLVILREHSSRKAYTIRTVQSVTHLRTAGTTEKKKVPLPRPTKHLSRQISTQSQTPAQPKASQVRRGGTRRSEDRKTKEAIKIPLRDSSKEPTPREKRQKSSSRQTRPSVGEGRNKSDKKTGSIPKPASTTRSDSETKSKTNDNASTKPTSTIIAAQPLDSDIWAATTNVQEVSKLVEEKKAEETKVKNVSNVETEKRKSPEGEESVPGTIDSRNGDKNDATGVGTENMDEDLGVTVAREESSETGDAEQKTIAEEKKPNIVDVHKETRTIENKSEDSDGHLNNMAESIMNAAQDDESNGIIPPGGGDQKSVLPESNNNDLVSEKDLITKEDGPGGNLMLLEGSTASVHEDNKGSKDSNDLSVMAKGVSASQHLDLVKDEFIDNTKPTDGVALDSKYAGHINEESDAKIEKEAEAKIGGNEEKENNLNEELANIDKDNGSAEDNQLNEGEEKDPEDSTKDINRENVKKEVQIKMEQMGQSDEVLTVSILEKSDDAEDVKEELESSKKGADHRTSSGHTESEEKRQFFPKNEELVSKKGDVNENKLEERVNEEGNKTDDVSGGGKTIIAKEEHIGETQPKEKSANIAPEDTEKKDVLKNSPVLTRADSKVQSIIYDMADGKRGCVDTPVKTLLNSFLANEKQHVFKTTDVLEAKEVRNSVKSIENLEATHATSDDSNNNTKPTNPMEVTSEILTSNKEDSLIFKSVETSPDSSSTKDSTEASNSLKLIIKEIDSNNSNTNTQTDSVEDKRSKATNGTESQVISLHQASSNLPSGESVTDAPSITETEHSISHANRDQIVEIQTIQSVSSEGSQFESGSGDKLLDNSQLGAEVVIHAVDDVVEEAKGDPLKIMVKEESDAQTDTTDAKGISKESTFIKKDNRTGLSKKAVESIIEAIKSIYNPNSTTDKASVGAAKELFDTFLQNEQQHVFQNAVENNQKDTNNEKTKCKQENGMETSNKDVAKIKRAKSVGITKIGERETKSKIPTPVRRSAGRRPLVRQLDADSKELEEKLDFKKLSSSSSTGSSKENDVKRKHSSALTKDDAFIAKTILKGVDGAENDHLNKGARENIGKIEKETTDQNEGMEMDSLETVHQDTNKKHDAAIEIHHQQQVLLDNNLGEKDHRENVDKDISAGWSKDKDEGHENVEVKQDSHDDNEAKSLEKFDGPDLEQLTDQVNNGQMITPEAVKSNMMNYQDSQNEIPQGASQNKSTVKFDKIKGDSVDASYSAGKIDKNQQDPVETNQDAIIVFNNMNSGTENYISSQTTDLNNIGGMLQKVEPAEKYYSQNKSGENGGNNLNEKFVEKTRREEEKSANIDNVSERQKSTEISEHKDKVKSDENVLKIEKEKHIEAKPSEEGKSIANEEDGNNKVSQNEDNNIDEKIGKKGPNQEAKKTEKCANIDKDAKNTNEESDKNIESEKHIEANTSINIDSASEISSRINNNTDQNQVIQKPIETSQRGDASEKKLTEGNQIQVTELHSQKRTKRADENVLKIENEKHIEAKPSEEGKSIGNDQDKTVNIDNLNEKDGNNMVSENESNNIDEKIRKKGPNQEARKTEKCANTDKDAKNNEKPDKNIESEKHIEVRSSEEIKKSTKHTQINIEPNTSINIDSASEISSRINNNTDQNQVIQKLIETSQRGDASEKKFTEGNQIPVTELYFQKRTERVDENVLKIENEKHIEAKPSEEGKSIGNDQEKTVDIGNLNEKIEKIGHIQPKVNQEARKSFGSNQITAIDKFELGEGANVDKLEIDVKNNEKSDKNNGNIESEKHIKARSIGIEPTKITNIDRASETSQRLTETTQRGDASENQGLDKETIKFTEGNQIQVTELHSQKRTELADDNVLKIEKETHIEPKPSEEGKSSGNDRDKTVNIENLNEKDVNNMVGENEGNNIDGKIEKIGHIQPRANQEARKSFESNQITSTDKFELCEGANVNKLEIDFGKNNGNIESIRHIEARSIGIEPTKSTNIDKASEISQNSTETTQRGDASENQRIVKFTEGNHIEVTELHSEKRTEQADVNQSKNSEQITKGETGGTNRSEKSQLIMKENTGGVSDADKVMGTEMKEEPSGTSQIDGTTAKGGETNLWAKKQEAAIKIQSAWKGFVVRKLMKTSRNQDTNLKNVDEKAIVKIQAIVRGFLERVRFGKLKSAAKLGVQKNDKESTLINTNSHNSQNANRPENLVKPGERKDEPQNSISPLKGEEDRRNHVTVAKSESLKSHTQLEGEQIKESNNYREKIPVDNNVDQSLTIAMEVTKAPPAPLVSKVSSSLSKNNTLPIEAANKDPMVANKIMESVAEPVGTKDVADLNVADDHRSKRETNETVAQIDENIVKVTDNNDRSEASTSLNDSIHNGSFNIEGSVGRSMSEDGSKTKTEIDAEDAQDKKPSSDKIDYCRSNTVEEPKCIMKTISHLGEDSNSPPSGQLEVTSGPKDDNNNCNKEESQLEKDVRSAVSSIMSDDVSKHLTPLEAEVSQAVEQIMKNNDITVNAILKQLPEVPLHEAGIRKNEEGSIKADDLSKSSVDSKSPTTTSNKLANASTCGSSTSVDAPDDRSSVGSVDSVVTVIMKPKNDFLDKPSDAEPGVKVDNKRLTSKALSTSALEDHVELIDQVQNSLLDQLSGKTVDSAKKFDIEELRKELHDAATSYTGEDDDAHHSSVVDQDAEVMQYLYDFEPEDDHNYEPRMVRTPLRDLPDIAEETESKEDDTQFCGTSKLDSHGQASNNCDAELMDSQSTSDAIVVPVSDSSHVSDGNIADFGTLKHTGEFHDTVVVPLPNVAELKREDEAENAEGTSRANTMDSGNQTSSIQQPPAGVEAVTSPSRRRSQQDGVAAAQAQASLKDATSAKLESDGSFTHQSPRTAEQAMESENENNNNKRNNAINQSVTADEKNMEAATAATKIQAGFRGYQVRKQLKAKTTALDQKRQLRKRSSRENMKDPELEEKSAVKIQAGVRGFLVRRRQKKQVNSSASA